MNKYSDFDKKYVNKHRRNYFKESVKATLIFASIIIAILIVNQFR